MEVLERPTFFWVHNTHVGKGWYQKGLYIAPYSKTMPNYAQPSFPSSGKLPNPWYAFYPRDVTINDYWLALTPRRFVFEGILEPLASIKLEQISEGQPGQGEWILANAFQWAELESNLRYLELSMTPITTGFLWPLEAVTYPLPSNYDLNRSFSIQALAKKHCHKLQALFLIFIGKLTFQAFMTRNAHPTWNKRLEMLQQSGDIRHEVADLIRASPIMHNSYADQSPIERVGM